MERIAVIPGDGVGPEVVAETEKVLRAVSGQDPDASSFTSIATAGARKSTSRLGDDATPMHSTFCVAMTPSFLAPSGRPWSRTTSRCASCSSRSASVSTTTSIFVR